jgi:hypothetical protein
MADWAHKYTNSAQMLNNTKFNTTAMNWGVIKNKTTPNIPVKQKVYRRGGG